MAKRTVSANVMIVGVMSLLAVGSWVAFDVVRSLTNTTLTEVEQKQILPLRVDVSDTIISEISAKKQYSDLFLNTVESRAVPGSSENGNGATSSGTLRVSGEEATVSPTPTAEVTPTLEATGAAELGGEETATGAAEL